MVPFVKRGRVYCAYLTVGQTSDVLMVGPQMTMSIHPDMGGKGLFEYSTSPRDDVEAGEGRWIPWAGGEVDYACSSTTEGRLTGLRARCTVGAVNVEVL